MEENVLVRTLGDTHLLKVLGFFLEHPVHQFQVTALAEYLDISRETIRKDLALYEELGYIAQSSPRGPYRLRLSSEMVRTLISCATRMAEARVRKEVELPIWEPTPYPTPVCVVPRTFSMQIAGA
jgi:hypothetical protein